MSKDKTEAKEHRIIYITGELDEDKGKIFTETLLNLEGKNFHKDILVWVDTYGGDADTFLSMHDAIRLMRCPVATICIGKAMSAGAMLLMSGAKGKRFITRNARVMTHQMWGAAHGTLSEMEIDIREQRRLQDLLESIFCQCTGLPMKRVQKLVAEDRYMTPQEAKRLGIVDWVVTKASDLYGVVNV